MNLLPTVLPLSSYRGSVRACAKAYGDEHAEAIDGWLKCEIPDYPKHLRYAGRCWQIVRRWHRPLAEFIAACAAGARRPVEEIVALLATEEIFHDKHCTAFGATGDATVGGQPVIAQNWDGVPRTHPWSRLVRLRTDAMPATLTYSFPGLWACAGINEHGLSLVWTSSGCKPSVRSVVGVPTYLLTAGVLACRDVASALEMLDRVPNAGAFNFFLADPTGAVVVVEGMPGCIKAVRCAGVISRANHYEEPELVRRSGQRLPRAPRGSSAGGADASTAPRSKRCSATSATARG